ncbi:MAG TPA: ribulose-phosphate 3-epimerase [Bacteroidales bacterium]|nr:ribulose-phosphate 3-epimerase [Bacteroidales bacterium]HQB36476.1 ribulose-phosphate 3-epimerase [Bacteroidales bacterium]
MNHLVSPSILSADFGSLEKDIKMLNDSVADWIHCDIMDGVFVPNISFGFPVVEFVKKVSAKPLDVHLMTVDPDRYVNRWHEAGADMLTVHYEACVHLHRTVTEIQSLGMKAGVALNPHTPVSLIDNILPYVDMILIMTVNPGFGGQLFIVECYNKIAELRKMIDSKGIEVMIQVDGGVDLNNAPELVNAGVNVLVAGHTIFSSAQPAETIRQLKYPF